MKEKISQVSSQISVEDAECSQQLCFYNANSRVTLTCASEAIIYSRLASLMQFKLSTNVGVIMMKC